MRDRVEMDAHTVIRWFVRSLVRLALVLLTERVASSSAPKRALSDLSLSTSGASTAAFRKRAGAESGARGGQGSDETAPDFIRLGG